MQPIFHAMLRILSISLLRYFILAGTPFLIYYIWRREKMGRAKIQERSAGRKDFWREIAHSLQTTLVFTAIAMIIWFTPLKKYTLVYDHVNDHPLWWIPVFLVLSLVIHDTYFYWMHRLLHHKKIFRHAHLLHHRSVNPSPFTSYSFHFLEAWAEGGVLLLLVFILPMHQLTVLLFTIAGFIINVYGHLGYEIAPRWLRHTFLFEILNTSTHHNLHHSKFEGNYGLYFRVWDRLMGTENPGYVKDYDRMQEQRFGEVEGSRFKVEG